MLATDVEGRDNVGFHFKLDHSFNEVYVILERLGWSPLVLVVNGAVHVVKKLPEVGHPRVRAEVSITVQ